MIRNEKLKIDKRLGIEKNLMQCDSGLNKRRNTGVKIVQEIREPTYVE